MLIYSLTFGLAAWLLAGIAIAVKKRGNGACVWGSFLCAAASALTEFLDLQRRAFAGDYAGIEDTIRAIFLGVLVMFAVTLALNFLALTGKQRQK